MASQLSPTIIVCIYLLACKIPTCPYKRCDCITLYFLCCPNCSLEQTPQSVHVNMSGLLGLSGSLPLFLSLCCFSLSPLAINPLFSCYCISHCIFPPIFPSVQMFPFDLFMSDTMSECPVHFLWDHSAFISFHLDARFLPLCSPTQLLQFIFLPPALKFFALMLFFPPLVRSLFLLYLSPSSAFPLSFIFCLPLCPSFLYDPI